MSLLGWAAVGAAAIAGVIVGALLITVAYVFYKSLRGMGEM